MKGKVIIVIGFILCLVPYLLVFGLPIYVLGVLFLIKTERQNKIKIYWISISFFILIIVYFILIKYIEYYTGEKCYLIHKNP